MVLIPALCGAGGSGWPQFIKNVKVKKKKGFIDFFLALQSSDFRRAKKALRWRALDNIKTPGGCQPPWEPC